jgi:hypothetical protein
VELNAMYQVAIWELKPSGKLVTSGGFSVQDLENALSEVKGTQVQNRLVFHQLFQDIEEGQTFLKKLSAKSEKSIRNLILEQNPNWLDQKKNIR